MSLAMPPFAPVCPARTPESTVNEALAKIVCHNLTCVIMSQCELGIEAEFWTKAGGRQGGRA